MSRIGVQAMMLKDDFAEHGPFETLRRVRDIGYRAVEVSQIPMTAANVAELRRARDELGMDIAALSASLTARPGGLHPVHVECGHERCGVAQGNLDFAAIVPASVEIGAEYLLVEQDERYGRSPLDCLATSHDNLVALGFGDLF